ncbi:udp-n-acetylenolpyruvoylglucosamine reductase, partial [Thozetella sp. PMI_491]
IEWSVELRPYNTFSVSSIAKALVRIQSEDDLHMLVKCGLLDGQKRLILGGGSNVLFAEPFFNGIILKNEVLGMQVVTEDAVNVILRIGSGVPWKDVTTYCIDHDLGGVENLALIPGTVGATPVQNVGAYGAQVSDIIQELEAIDLPTGIKHIYTNKECKFAHRQSIFSTLQDAEKPFITAVTMRLKKAHHYQPNDSYPAIRQTLNARGLEPTIRSVSEAVCSIRRSKLPDPAMVGNAGSFFKNPLVANTTFHKLVTEHPCLLAASHAVGNMVSISAARLIEECGWKGKRRGAAAVYQKHALVLVNYGSNGSDILSLAQEIQGDVYGRFDIHLVPEVNII